MIALKERLRSEDGFSIVEIMVVTLLLGLLTGVFYGFLFGAQRASDDGRRWLELNSTARLVLERMAREMREADLLRNGSNSTTVGFQADFNSSGSFATGTFVPDITPDEILEYKYDAAAKAVMIKENPSSPTSTAQTLATNVAAFEILYFGSDPRLDGGCVGFAGSPSPAGCAAGDGTVFWQEIDRSSAYSPPVVGFGNNNGTLDIELNHITSIQIKMTVALRQQSHTYEAKVELRNLFK